MAGCWRLLGNLAVWAKTWFAVDPFYRAFCGFGGAVFVYHLVGAAVAFAKAVISNAASRWARLRALLRQPLLVAAIAAGSIGYGVMVLVMTATPLAIRALQAFDFSRIASVIRWHVLGMFVPVVFTGHLLRYWGSLRVIVLGCVLLVLVAGLTQAWHSYTHFLLALVVLGVGLEFTFIGADAFADANLSVSVRAMQRHE